MTIQLIGNVDVDNSSTKVPSNPPINTIHIPGKRIEDSVIDILKEIVQLNPNIHTFSLSVNHLGSSASEQLADAIRHNTSIHTFKLVRNHLGYVEANRFAQAVRTSSSIHTLRLTGKKAANNRGKTSFNLNISNFDRSRLIDAIKSNPNIHVVSLVGATLTLSQVERVAEMVRDSKHIRTLNLIGDKLGASEDERFVDAICDNTGIQTLSLVGTKLGYFEVGRFADALRNKTNASSFYLIDDHLGHAENDKLVNAILSNPAIEHTNVTKKEHLPVRPSEETTSNYSSASQPQPVVSLLRKSKTIDTGVGYPYVANGLNQFYSYPMNYYTWPSFGNVYNGAFANGYIYPYGFGRVDYFRRN